MKALVAAAILFVWLELGMQPTGWLFYELHHATGFEWIYWGYTIFRGGSYLYEGLNYHTWISAGAALILGLIILWRGRSSAAGEM